MDGELLDIINGNMLGDASVGVYRKKYYYYKHTAKDIKYLEWIRDQLESLNLTFYLFADNKINKTNALGFYINRSRIPELLSLREQWYKKINGKPQKTIPKDLELNPTTLLHWYLGDGSLIRQKDASRVPRIVLATNTFSQEDLNLLIEKLGNIGLNFYPLQSYSGFTKRQCGSVLISNTSDGTPFRFFKSIGLECPEEIKDCYTGSKGRGAKRHYMRDKWPAEGDWLRILSNVNGTGKIIKERRSKLKISQGQLAKKAGTTRDYLKQMERDKRHPSVILFKKLLNTLNINAIYLLKKLE